VDVADHHLGAFFQKRLRDGVSDASRAPGNERDLAFDVSHLLPVLLELDSREVEIIRYDGMKLPAAIAREGVAGD